MKQLKKIIPLLIIAVVILAVGYFLRKERVIHNQGDTYYVMDYFTISKLATVTIILGTVAYFGFKMMIRKGNTNNHI